MEPVLNKEPQTKTPQAKAEDIVETTEYCPISKIHRTIRRKGDVLLDVTEKDSKGALVKTEYDGDRVVCVTEVDEKGHLQRMTCTPSKGKRAHVYTFEYDENGYLVRQKSGFGVPILPTVTEWWRKPVRQTSFSKWKGQAVAFEEGHEPDVNEYEGMTKGVFENGQISRVVAYDFIDHPRRVKHYSKGKLIQEIMFEIRGGLTMQRRYNMRRDGNFIVKTMSESIFNGRNRCMGMTYIETRLDKQLKPQSTHIYSNGALTRRIIYSQHGQQASGEKMESDYNYQGRCVEDRFLTMNDELLSAVRYEYNDITGRCTDSYKWNGQEWFSEKNPGKKAPAELSAPPVVSADIPSVKIWQPGRDIGRA